MIVVPPPPPTEATGQERPEQQPGEQPATAAKPSTAGETTGVPDVGRLVIGVQRDGRLAVRTRLLQIRRWRRRRASLDDRPDPVHRVPRLSDHPGDANQVDRLVGVVERGLRGAVPADGGVEVAAGLGMQLDLRLEAHDVVGEDRDLGSEQLPVRRFRPRPLSGSARRRRLPRTTSRPAAPAPPASTSGSTQPEPAAVVTGVSAVARTLAEPAASPTR